MAAVSRGKLAASLSDAGSKLAEVDWKLIVLCGNLSLPENVLARREDLCISVSFAVFGFSGGGLVRRQRRGETFLGGVFVEVEKLRGALE